MEVHVTRQVDQNSFSKFTSRGGSYSALLRYLVCGFDLDRSVFASKFQLFWTWSVLVGRRFQRYTQRGGVDGAEGIAEPVSSAVDSVL
jgi:hypothetical protein